MAKALIGHVGGPDPRMIMEMRRLQERVRTLETEVLRLRAEGVSQRGISDVLRCSRNTVAAVVTAAAVAGIDYAQVVDRSPDEVRELLLVPVAKLGSDRVAPDFEWVHFPGHDVAIVDLRACRRVRVLRWQHTVTDAGQSAYRCDPLGSLRTGRTASTPVSSAGFCTATSSKPAF